MWSVLIAVVLFWLFRTHGFDDPFITYRYAANIASGQGFVYNSGEQVLSTTTPLYAMLLALGALAHLDIPLLSMGIGCTSLALGGLALWGLGKRWQAPLAGGVALLLYPTSPLLILTLGAETVFYVCLILIGFWACASHRYMATAVLLALASLTRADGVVATGVAGLFVLLMPDSTEYLNRNRRKDRATEQLDIHSSTFAITDRLVRLWKPMLVYVGIVLPWFAFAWLYFGAPFPVTLAAKQHQGTMSISQSFFAGLLTHAQAYWTWHAPVYWPHMVLVLVGLVMVVVRHRHWLLVVGWSVLYALAYTLLGVTSYFWYYAPVVAGFVVLVAVGSAVVGRIARSLLPPGGWHAWATSVLLVVLVYPHALGLAEVYTTPDTRLQIYRDIGTWLHDNTPPDASVGALEVGIIGYYAERQMIDFAGLIQPETASQLTATTTFEDAALWAYERYAPDYLVLHEGLFPRLETRADFRARCQPVKQFVASDGAASFVVYECD